jgi:ATP-dependent DNA helicase RecQ
MLGLCDLTGCRRQALLDYFGEGLEQPCGNCDTCLDPPKTWDATEAAQKALSCVFRTGQRFGVNYLVEVLLGKQDARIQRNGHDRISTFAIGCEHSATEWRTIFRQLIARAYLDIDPDGHGFLLLTEKARPLLRGEVRLQLRHQPRPEKKLRAEKTASSPAGLTADEQLLFETLRTHRLRLAREQSVPPYVIFHDSTLIEMACHRPLNEQALRSINGVGEAKCARFGPGFLAVIATHVARKPGPHG